MKRVLLTVMHGGWICDDTVSALMDLRVESRVELTIERPKTTSSRPYVSQLNATARRVVSEGFDSWINIDADNPPVRNPVDLTFCDKDIIGCPTPVWLGDRDGKRPYVWNAFDHVPDKGDYEHRMHRPAANELEQVDAVGSGCIVIARRVLEHQGMKAPFNRKWTEWGEVECGTDLMFCKRAREAGFTVWAHFAVPCHHINEVDLMDVVNVVEAAMG
jgi:hypothetical protein